MKDKNWIKTQRIKNWLIYFSIMTLFSLAVLFVTFTDKNPLYMKINCVVIVAVFLIIVLSILMFISVLVVKYERDTMEEDEQTK